MKAKMLSTIVTKQSHEQHLGVKSSQAGLKQCHVLPVCPGGCGLQARDDTPTDAEGMADGKTQAAVDCTGRLRKLYLASESSAGL